MSWHHRASIRWARILAGLLAASVCTLLFFHHDRDPELPPWELTSPARPAEIARCAVCHERESESFEQTPHWKTLQPANTATASTTWDGAQFKSPADGWFYKYEQRDGCLWLHCSAVPQAHRVDWLFGSGTHAQTPVSTFTNPDGEAELIEHRITRYASGELGLTLGRGEDERLPAGLAALGKWHLLSETRQCFGCHASHLPHDDHTLRLDRLLPGVHCSRCHLQSSQHATAMESGRPERGTIEKLSDLPPLEQINRCGECHRRADQFPADELTADNRLLVRFAPVGLALSRCFQEQPSRGLSDAANRFDCLTCHDPHQAAATTSEFYRQKCVACHGTASNHNRCPSQPDTSDCLACHMPKTALNSQLQFTDHWIRIRSPEK